jgi:Flp pilus assembly protein TadD
VAVGSVGQTMAEGTFESFRRAETLLAQRRPLEALRELAVVVEAAPDSPSVHLLAGRAYLGSAQLNRAERAFLRVLELDPSDHYAHFALGRTLQRQGRLAEAKTQLRLASAMNPLPEYQEHWAK